MFVYWYPLTVPLFHLNRWRESPDLQAFQREVQSKGSIVQKTLCTRYEEERDEGGEKRGEQFKKIIRRLEIKAERVKSKEESFKRSFL